MKNNIFKILIVYFLFSAPTTLFAAELSIQSFSETINKGDVFNVEIFLNSPSEAINALEGQINFSSTLKLKAINFKGSVVSLWLTEPREEKLGAIIFAGVLPGGFKGAMGSREALKEGNIFSLQFEALEEGNAEISFDDSKVYINDGNGTLGELTKKNLSFSVLPTTDAPKNESIALDQTLPEPFTPDIIEGEPFGHEGSVLIFNTQDKDSGIDHYEIAYSNIPNILMWKSQWLTWREAESPFLISSDSPSKLFIYVRALDNSGNVRIETIRSSNIPFSIYIYLLIGIIVLIVVFLYVRHVK